jgi:hypothetical protein
MAKKPEKEKFDQDQSEKTERHQDGDTTWESREDGPYKQIICTSPRVRTLKDLIREAAIDERFWEITYYIANQWEQAQKNPDPDGPIIIVQLWQVKATMKKRLLEPTKYSILPVEVITADSKPATVKRSRRIEKRWLAWSDPHFSFYHEDGRLQPVHDESALMALEQLMTEESFYGSVCLGDLLDLAEFSDKYTTKAAYRHQTQRALIEAARWLVKLNTHVLIEGNHDERLPRIMEKWNQEILGLRSVDEVEGHPALSIPKLLNLKKRKVQWVGGYPSREWVIGDVHLLHGDVARSQPGATAKAYLKDCDHSVMYGHIHRQELVVETRGDQHLSAVGVGCTCHIDGRVPGHQPRHQKWQQGAAVLTEFSDGSTLIELVPITEGVARWRGKEYRGS